MIGGPVGNDDTVDIAEAASFVNVSKATIKDLLERGRIRGVNIGTRGRKSYVVRVGDLRRLKEALR